MKNFIYKIIFLVLLLLSLFYIADKIISNGLKKSQSNNYIDWNRMYHGQINADIIINGDSKAWLQINPAILDTVLHQNSYNLGIDGHDFFVQKHRYDIYEKYNKKPKILIQVIGNTTLQKRKDLFNIDQFLPYIQDTTIKKMTKDYEGFTYTDYQIPFVRYFGHTNSIINGLASSLGKTDLKKSNKYKGFYTHNKKWDNSFKQFKKTHKNGKVFKLDSSYKYLFKQFVLHQSGKKIQLILVYTPTFYESQKYVNNRREILTFYKNISNKYKVPLLDYSKLPLTKSTQFFYNSQHLNEEGSTIFSHILASDIKKIINSKIK